MQTDEFLRMLPLIAPLVLIQLGLAAVALVDLVRRERTRGPKWAWALVILFVSLLGSILYFLVGREEA